MNEIDKTSFRSLAGMVEDHIQAAVSASDGNLTEAAKLLGIGRATLYRRYPVKEFTRKARKKTTIWERRKKLREVTKTASGDSAGDRYQLGVANGLILARHIMEGRTGSPAYL